MHPANAKLLEYVMQLFFVTDPVHDCIDINPSSLGVETSAEEVAMKKVMVRGQGAFSQIIPFHTSSVTKTYRCCSGKVAVLTWQNEQVHRVDLNPKEPHIVAAGVPHAMIFECGPAEFYVSFSASPPAPVWLEGTEVLLRNRH